MSSGASCASRNEILYYPTDFDKEPLLYKSAENVGPEAEEAFRISNSLLSKEEKLRLWRQLSFKYPSSPFITMCYGHCAFDTMNLELYCRCVEKAYELDPENQDIMLDMASVACADG